MWTSQVEEPYFERLKNGCGTLLLNAGLLEFGEFCLLAANFLVEEDEEALKKELKEAFRIYDKDHMGYISTETLKEILRELDSKLTEEDLTNIIDEVDQDGSGTLDMDEFMEMMAG